MKKFILAAMLLVGIVGRASAFQESYDKGFSTMVVTGIICTSGTVVNLTSTVQASTWSVLSGYNLGGYRIQNQDSTYSMWLGGQSVSTTTISAIQKRYLGEKILPGGSVTYIVGRDANAASPGNVSVFCRADDSVSTNGIVVSIAIFGYK